MVAFVFFIVGCATSSWSKDVFGYQIGLWRYCLGNDESNCADLPSGITGSSYWAKYQAVRSFSIIAVVTTFIAWVLSIWFIFRYSYAIKWTIIVFATLGWISGLIAMSIWVSIHNDNFSTGTLGYSWALTTAGWCILFIVTILLWFVDYGVALVAAPIAYAAPVAYAPAPISYAAPVTYTQEYAAPAQYAAAPMAAPTVAVATNYAGY